MSSSGASSSAGANARVLETREAILQAFDGFRAELDEHHDRRERLIKSSRDITIASKKAIFLLHRLVASESEPEPAPELAPDQAPSARSSAAPVPNASDRPNTNTPTPQTLAAAREGRSRLAEVQRLLAGQRADLAGAHFWRYQSAVSPGLQEYVEAHALAHYLETGRLVSYAEVRAGLCDAEGEFFPLPLEEYLLGVSDLTGELMRFAITAIARRGGRTRARAVSDFVRACKADFEGFTPYVKYLGKKQAVTAQSLLKIEDAAYAIAVRASEYAGSEEILEDIVARCVSDVRGRPRRGEGGYVDGAGVDMVGEEESYMYA